MAVVGTKQGASLLVAAESSFGSVDATAARDFDTTTIAGLTAYPMRVLRASWNTAAGALRQVVLDQQEISTRGGTPAPIVESAVAVGAQTKRLVGEISVDVELRGFGANAPASTGLGIMLSSGLAHSLVTPGTTATVTYATVNTFTVGGGDLAEFVAGRCVFVEQADGTDRLCKVTNVNGGTSTITTLEAHGYSGAGTFTVRQAHMWYPPTDGSADGASLVLQFAPRDAAFVYVAVGARLSGFSTKLQGKVVVGTLKFTVPDGFYQSSAIITVPAKMLPLGVTGTTPLRTLVSPVLVTQDHSGSSVPYSGTAAALPVRDWSADVAVALEPTPDQGTRSGISGYSVAEAMCGGSFTVNAPTSGVDWREQLRAQESRAVGLTAAGSVDAGNGFGIWIGSADATEDPGITFEDSRRSQAVTFRAGDYGGDAAGADYANAPFAICFKS